MSAQNIPRITAVIPAYNSAAFVHRAIESVLNQTLQPCNIVVVDDGSADNTAEVVAAYAPRVTLVRQPNGGPGAARNHGARIGKGDWIALLDADDAWLPNKLERQAPYTADPAVGLIHATERGTDRVPDEITFERLWMRNCVANSSAIIRRSAWEQVGGCDTSRELIAVEDYNLWLRIAAAGWKFVVCREKLINYTSEAGHLTSRYERYAGAEIANVHRTAEQLKLDPALVREKLLRVYDEQGQLLFYHRCLKSARSMFARSLRIQPSLRRFGWYLAACMPRPLLEVRHAIRERSLSPLFATEVGRESPHGSSSAV